MSKLTAFKGIPASGKSHAAEQIVREAKGKVVRVNKDLLRLMLHGGQWSKENEKDILVAEDLLISWGLTKGLDVIVDDCNYVHLERLQTLAETNGAAFDVRDFPIPLHEAIMRDAKRGEKSVGEKVIRDMYNRYVRKTAVKSAPREGFKECVLVDVDGTIADNCSDRSPYDLSKVSNDKPHLDVIDAVKKVAGDRQVVFLSGRDESCRADTKAWLCRHFMGDGGGRGDKEEDVILFMRPEGDRRQDAIVKKEIHDQHVLPFWDVHCVFDDRDRVVEMWRSLGYRVFQVADGDF